MCSVLSLCLWPDFAIDHGIRCGSSFSIILQQYRFADILRAERGKKIMLKRHHYHHQQQQQQHKSSSTFGAYRLFIVPCIHCIPNSTCEIQPYPGYIWCSCLSGNGNAATTVDVAVPVPVPVPMHEMCMIVCCLC